MAPISRLQCWRASLPPPPPSAPPSGAAGAAVAAADEEDDSATPPPPPPPPPDDDDDAEADGLGVGSFARSVAHGGLDRAGVAAAVAPAGAA